MKGDINIKTFENKIYGHHILNNDIKALSNSISTSMINKINSHISAKSEFDQYGWIYETTEFYACYERSEWYIVDRKLCQNFDFLDKMERLLLKYSILNVFEGNLLPEYEKQKKIVV